MRKITIVGMILAGLILLGVEIYSFITPEEGDTISEISWDLIKNYPVVGVLVGIVLGHIAWPLTKNIRDKRE